MLKFLSCLLLAGLGLCSFAGVWLAVPSSANARTLAFLGVRSLPTPVARFIVREAESAYTYETLSLLELPLRSQDTAQWTSLVNEKQALKHQRAGASDLHRIILEKKEVEARDDSELLGFGKAEEIACYSLRVEAKKPPIHLELSGEGHGYAWTCVLASGTTPAARLLLEVQRSATMIHFAPDNQRPVIRVAQIPHMQVEIPHRGDRALPVIALSKAYRVPLTEKQNEFVYMLVFERSLPLIPKLSTQEVLVLIHPDSLQRPDGGRITQALSLQTFVAIR